MASYVFRPIINVPYSRQRLRKFCHRISGIKSSLPSFLAINPSDETTLYKVTILGFQPRHLDPPRMNFPYSLRNCPQPLPLEFFQAHELSLVPALRLPGFMGLMEENQPRRSLSVVAFNSGMSCTTVFQTASISTPKYSWMSLSRIPAISLHGTSELASRNSADTFFAASPMISSSRITPSWSRRFRKKASKATPLAYSSIAAMASRMWRRYTSSRSIEHHRLAKDPVLEIRAHRVFRHEINTGVQRFGEQPLQMNKVKKALRLGKPHQKVDVAPRAGLTARERTKNRRKRNVVLFQKRRNSFLQMLHFNRHKISI